MNLSQYILRQKTRQEQSLLPKIAFKKELYHKNLHNGNKKAQQRRAKEGHLAGRLL